MQTVSTPADPLTKPVSSSRVGAIDVLRGLTMVLMIFVNDLWSLTDIPAWLEHVESGVDGIGLADVVFPAFLFIVGLSLPFAIQSRRAKGDNDRQLVGHVLSRTVGLLTMGVFLVNGESINEAATGMPRLLWNVIACICFVLIWNSYPKRMPSWLSNGLKGLGIVVLVVMAFVYRGEGEPASRFATHWWGILGLIGWSYLAAALVTVFAHDRLVVLVIAWVAFALLSMADQAHLLPAAVSFIPSAISGGTLAGLSMGGVVMGTLFQHYRRLGDNRQMTLVFIAILLILIGLSVLTRPYWGLSKLGATPAWLFLCSAFTILAFMVIYWLVDVYNKGNWFAVIKPAGTDTLLCYLMPYFAYALTTALSVHLPTTLLTGGVGLFQSLLFAILCVWVAGRLSKLGIRLKL
jgi:predicted acyltransferase